MNYSDFLESMIHVVHVAGQESDPGNLVQTLYEYPDASGSGSVISTSRTAGLSGAAGSASGTSGSRSVPAGRNSATVPDPSDYLHLYISGSPTLTSPARYRVSPADAAILLYVEKGEAQITLGRKHITVTAGCFAVIPAVSEFSVLLTLLPCTHTFYVFGGRELSFYHPWFSGTSEPDLRSIPEDPFSRHALDILRHIPGSVDSESLLLMHTALSVLLAGSLMHLSGSSRDDASDDSGMAPGRSPGNFRKTPGAPGSGSLPRYLTYLYNAIHIQYREPFSLEFYERQLGVNRYRLCREYSAAFGISPLKDLNRTRIRKAEELLAASDDQIQEIASRVGYEDPGHFIRMFRAETGVTPGAYRRQFRQLPV